MIEPIHTLNQTQTSLISMIAKNCLEYGISLSLEHKKTVIVPGEEENMGCDGFFSSNDKLLSVATDKSIDKWLGTLLHEYFHLCQWTEEPERFDKDDIEATRFWNWIEGKEDYSIEEMKVLASQIMDWEKDCELRCVSYLRHFPGLEIDPDRYAQAANVYIGFYPLVLKHRSWHEGISPTVIDEILDLMPIEFPQTSTFYWNPSKEFEAAVIKHCFMKKYQKEARF